MYVRATDPETSAALDASPWVRDGLVPPRYTRGWSSHPSKERLEFPTLLELAGLVRSSRESAMNLLGRPWIGDGVDIIEYTRIERLATIARLSPGPTSRLLGMPFLEWVDGVDAAAMSSLEELPQDPEMGYLRQALDHPTLAGGITDDLTVIVAALGMVVDYRTD